MARKIHFRVCEESRSGKGPLLDRLNIHPGADKRFPYTWYSVTYSSMGEQMLFVSVEVYVVSIGV